MTKPFLNPILAYFQRAGLDVSQDEKYYHSSVIDGVDYMDNLNSPKNFAINPDRRFVRKKKRERGAR